MSERTHATDERLLAVAATSDLLDQLPSGVYLVDRTRTIRFWNRGAEAISGYATSDVTGAKCSDNLLIHVDAAGNSLCSASCPLAATMDDGLVREARAFLHHRDGHRVPVRVRTSPIRDERGAVIGGIEIFDDDSAHASLQDEIESLRKLALIDPLTEVGNRRYLEIALASRRDELARYGWAYGLLVIDVDLFKRVNDRYGHAVGDRVLQMVARTLAANVRSSDTVGRWGGEEFLILLQRTGDEDLVRRAEMLRQLVEASGISAGDGRLAVTVSIGGTTARSGETARETFERADRNLYQAKQDGRNRTVCA